MEIVLLLENNGCRAEVVIKTNDPSLKVTVNDFYREIRRESHPDEEVEYREYAAKSG